MSAASSADALAHIVAPRPAARTRILVPVVAGCVATIAFVWLHVRLENFGFWVAPGDAASLRGVMAVDVARYVSLAGAAVLLVVHGRRRSFFLPALAYSAVPWLVGWSVPGCTPQPGRLLVSIGGGWPMPMSAGGCDAPNLAGPTGAGIDLALALLPALAVLAVTQARVEAGPEHREWSVSRTGSLLLVGFIAWAIAWVLATTGYGGLPLRSYAPTLVPLFLFGVLVGTLRPRWIAPLLAFPILLTTFWPGPLAANGTWPTLLEFRQEIPYLVTPVIAASWRAMAALLETLERRPLALLATVNVLNVADAVFTHIAVRDGDAVEANPVVRAIGLPLKVVAVAVLSVFLFRTRSRILTVAVLALCGVLVWHVAGSLATPR